MTPSISRIQFRHWGLVAAAAALATSTRVVGVGGVLLGGTASWFSLGSFAALFGIVFTGRRVHLAIVILSVKLLAILGLTWFAFTARHQPDPLGFAVGVSCLPAAAVWEALRLGKSTDS